MTAVINGVVVTGTPEEINKLISLQNGQLGFGTGTQPLHPHQPIKPYIVGDQPNPMTSGDRVVV